MTNVQLLLFNVEILLIVEKNKGRNLPARLKYAEANNKYMKN